MSTDTIVYAYTYFRWEHAIRMADTITRRTGTRAQVCKVKGSVWSGCWQVRSER